MRAILIAIMAFFYGRRFTVTRKELDMYRKIEHDLIFFPSGVQRVETVVVIGKEYELFKREVPIYLQYERMDQELPNLTVPRSLYDFVVNGGSYREIENWKAILGHGHLHGEKRRLVYA